jgi:hypothetical protein
MRNILLGSLGVLHFLRSPNDADAGVLDVSSSQDTGNQAETSAASEATQEAAKNEAPLADVAGPINEAAGAVVVVNKNFPITFRKDKLGNKPEGFTLTAPVPTLDGVIAALSDEKQSKYILDLIEDAIYSAVRDQVGDETKPVRKQDDLDVSKLTLEALANVPKAVRTGGGISKEVWEEFAKDYIAVMPAVTGKTVEQVTNASTIFVRKLQPVKTNMPALKFLQGQLAQYYSATENKEDFAQCVEFLDNKLTEFLSADEQKLIGNL